MSDEIHMESAWRHRDQTAREVWHGKSPDEAMMEAEEWEGDDAEPVDEARLMERLMVYLFSGEELARWENVALRAWAVLVSFAPHVVARRSREELGSLQAGQGVNREDCLRGLLGIYGVNAPGREAMVKLLLFIFPGEGRRWLLRGTQRAYLLARAYQPGLVSEWYEDPRSPDAERRWKEVTFERLAEIFDGQPLLTDTERDRARSRWSARADVVLRRPIESAGGCSGVHFSKSATSREKMRASARGNKNRQGGNAGVLAQPTKTSTNENHV